MNDNPYLDKFKELYESTKNYYDVPSFEEFVSDLQDSDKMFQLRESLEEHFDMPIFEDFLDDFGVKKKEQSEPEPLESSFDSAGFIQQEETKAKATLQEELAGKGYNVEETGVGDALSVTNTITGEQQDIDLQPIDFFVDTESEIEKVKKLVNTPTTPSESVLSVLNQKDFIEDTDAYVEKLKSLYGNRFDIQKEGGEVTIKKGDIEETFKVQEIIPADIRRKRTGSSKTNEQAFYEINKFMLDNMSDDDALAISENISFDAKKTQEAINNISTEINIEDETINGKLYSKDYFKTLFDRLESEGVTIPEDAKSKLRPGGNIAPRSLMDGVDGTMIPSTAVKPFDEEERQDLINQYFTEEQRKRIESYDKSQKAQIKLGLIDRTKKLKTETYYENSPLRETNKAIIRLNAKNISEKEVGIRATLFAAVNDHSKVLNEVKNSAVSLSEKYPGVEIKTVVDPETNQVSDIVSSEPLEEVEAIRKTLQSSQKNLYDLYQKSDKDIDTINSELETTEQYLDAAERNYNLVDSVWSDVQVAGSEAGGSAAILLTLTKEGLADLFGMPPAAIPAGAALPISTDMVRKSMADQRVEVSKYRARKRTYEEAISEGRKTRFALRTVADQSVNIGLALATAGAGSAVGMSKAAISTLISSEFGLTSSGSAYDAITTRQEQGRLAKEELKELEKYKGIISDEEYFNYKYDLERASKDADISATEKTLAVVGTGLVEFGVSRFIGTGVNALKFTKNIKAPKTFLQNIYRSNRKAVYDGLKEMGKSTLGEITEEVTIGVGGKLINYATMGDELDFSDLDDIAVTSIITSGAMNVPGTSYGTLMTQVNSGRYKTLFEQKRKEVQSLKNLLKDDSLSKQQRDNIHKRISTTIQQTAGITTEMEADIVLMGAEDVKESLMLSNIKHQALKKAGVKPEDTQEMVKAKIKNHIESLDKEDAERYVENIKYVDNKKKEIIGRLDYDNAIEKVFGEKGVEKAKKLPKKLTAKEKYTEIYKQFREDTNQKAKENFKEILKEEKESEVVIDKKQETVSDLINRPVTINELGGTKLESPIKGDLYVEGQQVVVEDADGNITELGNVDEVSDLNAQEFGFEFTTPEVSVNNDGTINVKESKYTVQKDLPTRGIEYNEDGDITSVSIKDEKGNPVMFKGQEATDIGYQILLDQATSPEQEQKINEILEKDEEFQNKLRETEDTTKEGADTDTKQDTKAEETKVEETKVEETKDTESKTPKSRKKQLLDLLKSTKPKAVELQQQVDNALKAISEVASDVEIIISDSEQDFIDKGGKEDAGGMYQQRKNKKVIYINPNKANSRTVAHEIFHALLLSKGISEQRARDITAKMMKAVAKSAPPGLQAYLKDFSKEYDSNIQNEEKLAELFGKLASEFDSLSDSTKNIIKKWLDKLAKILGLKEFTDAEVIDLLNTVSGKVARGKVISKNDISIFNQTGKEINESLDRFQASFSDIVSGITYEYDKNTDAFKKIASKYITRNRYLSDFDGKFVILHQPDMAFSGTIKKGDQLLVSGKGGVFYPIKFHEKGYFWASTEGAANDMAKSMNKTLKDNGGKIYLALTTAPRDKTLSSTNMSNGVLDLFMNLSKSPELNISETEMLNIVVDSYNKAFKPKKKKKSDKKPAKKFVEISKDDTRENILKKIRKTLGPTESVFNQRKAFSKKIIDDSANIIKDDKVASEYVYDIFGEGAGTFDLIVKNSKGVSISASGLVRATTQLLTEPMLRNDKTADDSGKVYAILEIDGEVEAVDAKDKSDHESYPKTIKSTSKSKTTLHLLRDRKDWVNTIIDPDTGKQVGDRKVLSKDPEKAKKGKMVLRSTQVMSPSAGVTFQGVKIDTNQRYQVVVSEARELAQIGLDNGFTDSEIAEVAAERGISAAEIVFEIKRIQKEKMIAGQNAENMYTDKGVVKNFLQKANKLLLSGKGFLPKSVQVMKEWMNGSIEANAKQATQAVNDFVRATKKYAKNELSETTKTLDKYMRGDLTAFDSLPEEIKPIAKRMRVHIDTLTSSLISAGAISADASIDNIILNMGSYMARSYKVHDDKKYTPTDALVNAAKQYLRKNSTKLQEQAKKMADEEGKVYEIELEELIDQNIKKLLLKDSSNDLSGFQSSAKVGSKKTKGMKQRLDIPKELRELMGEYESPIINYVKSIEKISNLVGNQVFLNTMKKNGEGVFLFDKPTGDFDVKIAGDKSKTMNPLDGMYTSKDIAEAMEKEKEIDLSRIPGLTAFYKSWLKTVGAVKYSKTILSPATHAKNIIGNLYFMAMNGYVDPVEYRKAFGIIMNDLQGKDNSERRALLDEYIRAGIINQSATLGEINSMFNRKSPFTDTIESNTETEKKAFSLTNNAVTKAGLNFGKTMSSLYQAEDDMFKIISYENEKARYIKAKTDNASFNKLSESDKAKVIEDAKNMAAENVKNILPNYNRIGRLGKGMKVIPIAGTFISFTLEAMRTGANTVRLAVSETKDPALRSIGLKRIAGILTVMSLKAAVIAHMGIDDEDDEITDAVRNDLPHWHKNSRIAVKSLKDGQLVYSSISDIDPHAFVDKALIAAFREDDVFDGVSSAAKSVIEPFFAPDILLSTVFQIFSNETAYGSPIYNKDLGSENIAKNVGSLVWKTIEPGGVKSAIKLYEAGASEDGSFWNELRGQATGVKDIKVDLVRQNGFKMRALKKRANATGREYNSAHRKFYSGDRSVSVKDVQDAYSLGNEGYKEVMTEAWLTYERMLKYGINQRDIQKAMKSFNKKEKQAISRGYIIDMKWKD